jgi:hypothetical protein
MVLVPASAANGSMNDRIFMNKPKYLVQYSTDNAITQARLRGFCGTLSEKSLKSMSFDSLCKARTSMSEVTIFRQEGGSVRLTCTCKVFSCSGFICSEVLAGFELLGLYETRIGAMALEPVRGSGRPPLRTAALMKMKDLADLDAIEPSKLKNAPVWDNQHGYGFVLRYRVKPDEHKTVVWKMNFLSLTKNNQPEWEKKKLFNGIQLLKLKKQQAQREEAEDWD